MWEFLSYLSYSHSFSFSHFLSSSLGYFNSHSEVRCLENNSVGDGDRDKEEIENGSDSERDEDEEHANCRPMITAASLRGM